MRWNGRVVGVLLVVSSALQAQDTAATAPSQPKTSYCGSVLSPASQPVTPLKLVHRVNPEYPKEARRAKLEGTVRLAATIATDGTVKDINVLAGEQALVDAAVEAVKQWRYEPALVNGTAVQVSTEITVNFALARRGKEQDSGQSVEAGYQTPLPRPPVAADSAAPHPIYAVGGDVKPPKAVYDPEPTYADSARKAGKQGTVALAVVVTSEGTVHDVEVCKSLDPALDEKAVEAVSSWKFQPATKDGNPVAVHIMVEVSFHLYR